MKRNLKYISLLLVMMIIFVGIVGCSGEEQGPVEEPGNDIVEDETKDGFPLEVEDAFGNKVTLEKAPERIISLVPSHTEILFALGLEDKVVGVTSFCDYPEQALAVEKIGDYNGTNLEKVIELEPDLIVNYGDLDDDSAQVYNNAGIPVISYMSESIDEVIDTIKQIGLATDSLEVANDLVANMEEHRDEIVAKVENTDSVRVFYEIWHDPLMAAGEGSFVDGLINLANGVNVARDAEGEYPNYDIEQLVENDPEYYLTANMETGGFSENTVESISARPGYENISAVKNGDIYLLDGNIISRPGPRIVEGLELIARTLHPEAFE